MKQLASVLKGLEADVESWALDTVFFAQMLKADLVTFWFSPFDPILVMARKV